MEKKDSIQLGIRCGSTSLSYGALIPPPRSPRPAPAPTSPPPPQPQPLCLSLCPWPGAGGRTGAAGKHPPFQELPPRQTQGGGTLAYEGQKDKCRALEPAHALNKYLHYAKAKGLNKGVNEEGGQGGLHLRLVSQFSPCQFPAPASLPRKRPPIPSLVPSA